MTRGVTSFYLFINSPELKAQVSYSDRRLSVVCLAVRLSVNFYIFNFFSKTTGPILTRLGTDHPWGEVCWLVIYGFTFLSRIFHLYGDVTIAGGGLQNLGLCPLSREGSLSCNTCCDMGPRFIQSHPKDRPTQSPLTTHEGVWRIYSNLDPHGDPWEEGFQVCSNEGDCSSTRGDNKRVKIH
jgi:hypothetical protein